MVTALRKRKRLLALLNAGLLATIALCAYHLLGNPATAGPIRTATPPADEVSGANAVAAVRPLNRTLFTRDYRKPLYDVTKRKVNTPPPPKPKLTVTCVGTIIGNRPVALLCGKTGQTKSVGIGQSLDNAEVTAIDVNSATVTFHGETIELPVKKD